MDESAVEETPQAHVASHVNTRAAESRVNIPATQRQDSEQDSSESAQRTRGKRRRGRRRH